MNGEDRATLLAQLLYERFPAASAVEYEARQPLPAPGHATPARDPILTAQDAADHALRQQRDYRQAKAAQRLEQHLQASRRIIAAQRAVS